jgi:hypothetical protein
MAAGAAAFAACGVARALVDEGAAPQSMPRVDWPTVAGWGAAGAAAAVALARIPWFRAAPHRGPSLGIPAGAALLAFALSFLLGGLGAWMAGEATALLPGAGGAAGDAAGRAAGGAAAPSSLRSLALAALGSRVGQFAAFGAALVLAPALLPSTAGARAAPQQRPRGLAESLLLAAAWALLLWPVAQGAGALAGAAEALAGAARPALGHTTLEALSSSGPADPWWWATVALAVAVSPVAEELVYRGLLQQGLKAGGMRPGAAVAMTSVLFAAVHVPALTAGAQAAGLATLVALSVGWGFLYERTGRLAAPMLAHAAFNAVNVAVALPG